MDIVKALVEAKLPDVADEITKLREQLALRDLSEMKLREVLLDICCDSEGNAVIGSDGDKAIINEALATPFTPTLLQEWYQGMVGEVVAWNISETQCYSKVGAIYHSKREAKSHVDGYIGSPVMDGDTLNVIKLYTPKEFKA